MPGLTSLRLMPALWPASLPQSLTIASHDEVDRDNLVRFQPTSGPPQLRRVATAVSRNVNGSLVLTYEQLDILQAFFRDTLKSGALAFEWKNHITGNVCSYLFRSPPPMRVLGGRSAGRALAKVRVQLELEIVPGSEIAAGTPPPPPPPPPVPEPQDFFYLESERSEPEASELLLIEYEDLPWVEPDQPVFFFSAGFIGDETSLMTTDVPLPAPVTGTETLMADQAYELSLYRGTFPLITIQ